MFWIVYAYHITGERCQSHFQAFHPLPRVVTKGDLFPNLAAKVKRRSRLETFIPLVPVLLCSNPVQRYMVPVYSTYIRTPEPSPYYVYARVHTRLGSRE